MQKSKQINKPIYTHQRDVCIPGSLVYLVGVCSNSIESATQTNRKLRWFDSWVFNVRLRCTSTHFPVNGPLPPAVTGGRGVR